MNPVLVGCLIGVVALLLIVVAGKSKSLSVVMLHREVGEAVQKARPGASITKVEVEGPGDLRIIVQDQGDGHQLRVVNSGKFTAAIGHDPIWPSPRSGTYSFDQPLSARSNDVEAGELLEMRERIETAINAALPARGFHRIAAGRPDVLVAYYAATDGPLSAAQLQESHGNADADWMIRTGTGKGGSGDDSPPVYEKGSLILDVLEPASRRLVWRAAVVACIVMDVPAETKDRRVQEAVELALRFFPPGPSLWDRFSRVQQQEESR